MITKLSKGSKIKLKKDFDNLTKIKVSLNWMTPQDSKYGKFDLDVTAYGLIYSNNTSTGFELFDDEYFIFYDNKKTSNGSIIHSGDDLDGDNGESIDIDLTKIPDAIINIPFFVTIHRATKKNQHFGLVKNASISINNVVTNELIAIYTIDEKLDGDIAVQFGTLYKDNGEWEFQAIGEGSKNDLSDILYSFGVEVEN